MKLWKVWSVFGLGTACLFSGLASETGCSPGSSNDGGTEGSVGQPPPPPPPNPGTANVETFAVKYLFLGEAARPMNPPDGPPSSQAPDTNAWKLYGYNLDGKVTTKTSTDVCTLAQGAPKDNQVDGMNGIDNSFGSVILPIIQSAASLPTPSTTISAAIDKGDFTILLEITGLDDTNPSQSATGLAGQLFAGGALPTPPTFDMTTDWPVSPQLLVNPTDPTKSMITFNQGYISNGTYVSGNLATGGITVTISLVFQGVPLSLSVNHAVITFDHTGNPNEALNGTIAGVIDTTQLINGLKAVAGRISMSLCGSAFNGIAQQITYASDILTDGSNMMGTACTGISIGLGFTGAKIKNPDTVYLSDGGVPPDPCAMSDGGGNDANMGNDTGGNDATGQ